MVEGEWWPADYTGPPLLSIEKRLADGLGLTVGDALTVNVLGRNITAPSPTCGWWTGRASAINFVLVYSPSTPSPARRTPISRR